MNRLAAINAAAGGHKRQTAVLAMENKVQRPRRVVPGALEEGFRV